MKVLVMAHSGAKMVVLIKLRKSRLLSHRNCDKGCFYTFRANLIQKLIGMETQRPSSLRNIKLFMFLISGPKEKLQIPMFGTLNGRVLKETIIIIMVPTSTVRIQALSTFLYKFTIRTF